MSEKVDVLCAELSLAAVAEQYANLADEAAKKKRSFVDYLEQVLRAEARMLETLRRLGVTSSFSRPRVSNDNAYAESLFRTCKYRPNYPVNGFATIDDARDWVLSFSRWYNTEHKHSGLKFTTPEQRHTGKATAILEHRQQVYRKARARHPNRWSGEIRNWVLPEKVWLNPEKEPSELNQAA